MTRIVASSVLVTLSVVGLLQAGAGPAEATVTLKGHKGTLSCLAFTRDGKTLASGGKDGVIILWDVATRKSTVRIPGHKDLDRNVILWDFDRLLKEHEVK
jgi:WD40 repeat protein